MILIRGIWSTFLVLALGVLACNVRSGGGIHDKAFSDFRERQPIYPGPGRADPPPADIKEVLIGYFGPSSAAHPQGGDMWCAAQLAIEEANQAGGYNGLPFRLVTGWSDNPWGSGVKEVTRMVYVHKVWAIIGGIDGPTTHLAEQVVAKARLALLNPASTDKTVNLANVPWMFSCLPQDHLQASVLAQAMASRLEKKAFVLVSAVDHDSHLFTVELARFLAAHQLAPKHHLEFNPNDRQLSDLADRIEQSLASASLDASRGSRNVDALVLIAGARESANLVRAIRDKGYAGPIFGGSWMGQRRFVEEAGKAANGVIFPQLYVPCTKSTGFEQKFIARFGSRPDYLAAHTYDTVNLLIAAIRRAGLNRARIRDAIRELSPWKGVTGDIIWDSPGGNARLVTLGTVENGQIKPLSETNPNGPPISCLSLMCPR